MAKSSLACFITFWGGIEPCIKVASCLLKVDVISYSCAYITQFLEKDIEGDQRRCGGSQLKKL